MKKKRKNAEFLKLIESQLKFELDEIVWVKDCKGVPVQARIEYIMCNISRPNREPEVGYFFIDKNDNHCSIHSSAVFKTEKECEEKSIYMCKTWHLNWLSHHMGEGIADKFDFEKNEKRKI